MKNKLSSVETSSQASNQSATKPNLSGLRPSILKNYPSPKNPSDLRLGHLTNSSMSKETRVALLGYPDDSGISLNSGRPGAAQGPDEIRRQLYRMTWGAGLRDSESEFGLSDLGNLEVRNEQSLGERHQIAQKNLEQILSQNCQALTFGGGHDYGYPDGAAFLNCYKESRPLVLNFDAHLDVRPTRANQDSVESLSSGTPFYRLLKNHSPFEFWEIGIGEHCNQKDHFDFCEEFQTQIISMTEMNDSHLSAAEYILSRLSPALEKPRPVFISLDIDCVSASEAPGASQSWPFGLSTKDLFRVLKVIWTRMPVPLFGIYEVSPPLDQSDLTTKLAAQISYEYLKSQMGSSGEVC